MAYTSFLISFLTPLPQKLMFSSHSAEMIVFLYSFILICLLITRREVDMGIIVPPLSRKWLSPSKWLLQKWPWSYIAAALSQLIDLGVGSPYELSQSSELFPDGENFRCNNWKLLVVVVQKDMVRSSPPVPQKVTLFGNRVFTEIINLK